MDYVVLADPVSLLVSLALNTALYFASRLLTPSQNFDNQGPRLRDAAIASSAEGNPIPRVYGRMRVGGNLIWSTNFLETVRVTKEKAGGKGGGGSTVTTTTYTYTASFAYALCEGHSRVQLGRIWLDGREVDLSTVTYRFYPGSEVQLPDPVIVATEGVDAAPAYRGTTYIVFEDLELANYGNRIPQLSAEVIAPLEVQGADDLETLMRGVCFIPATGEFAYGTTPYVRDDGYGGSVVENVHTASGQANALVALDQLDSAAPNMGSVVLVVSWFGSDLRAGECLVKPKVEFAVRDAYDRPTAASHWLRFEVETPVDITNDGSGSQLVAVLDGNSVVETFTVAAGATVRRVIAVTGRTVRIAGWVASPAGVDDGAELSLTVFSQEVVYPYPWKVSGVARKEAEEVPRISLDPLQLLYGGTPSDQTVLELIQEIKSRGWKVVFYPFLLMEQLEGNGLPDPYGGAEQARVPWRGRITCHPAPGQPGTVDKTATAATQVAAFFGAATASDVGTGADGLPTWVGDPDEWSWRRMVLHYARLCELAGGVDAFLIGTEFVGLTSVRSAATTYPAVDQFVSLAAEVSTILDPSTKVSYAADWSEYHSHRPSDGSGDLIFNMDPLWASAHIDFIGIDNYLPMSDWRDGNTHLDYDAANGVTSPYVLSYLKDNIEGGEYYDWFYASDSDRDNQVRTPIADGAYSKPWVFRQKDIRNWWSNAHYNRPGGTESVSPTGWTASSKPVWFTELGCPAVDRGSNQPNVFYDPKSSENALPHYSRGTRDDLIQRRYNEAALQYWRDNGGGMVSTSDIHIWNWDTRPYPAFPQRTDVWADGDNWQLSHSLQGRLGLVGLADLVEHICGLVGLQADVDVNTTGLFGAAAVVRGYVVDSIQTPREMLEPLMGAYSFDGFESAGQVVFQLRGFGQVTEVPVDDLVSTEQDPGGYMLTRLQETELPSRVKVTFYDEVRDYDKAGVDSQKRVGDSLTVVEAQFPLVLTHEQAKLLGDVLMHEAWTGRERASFQLPPSLVRLDPNDVIRVTLKGRTMDLRANELETGYAREVQASAYDQSVYDQVDYSGQAGMPGGVTQYGRPVLAYADLPLVTGLEERPWAPRVLAYQSPWPGAVNVFQSNLSGGWELNTVADTPSVMGQLVSELPRSHPWRWDRGTAVEVDIFGPAALLTLSEEAVLSGRNALAIETPLGWEVLQFTTVELVGAGRYRLTNLLRGQLGTEWAMGDPTPAGSRVIVIDQSSLEPLLVPSASIGGTLTVLAGPAPLPASDGRYTQEVVPLPGAGVTPYAPVHLAGARVGADIALSWVRRTRYDGDSWVGEAPLNEDAEAYEVDIMSGGSVVRTLTAASPTVTYTAAQEAADFGSTQSTLTFRVSQLSALVGRGRTSEATVNV